MKEFWNVIQMVFTAVGGWLGYFLGGYDGLDGYIPQNHLPKLFASYPH